MHAPNIYRHISSAVNVGRVGDFISVEISKLLSTDATSSLSFGKANGRALSIKGARVRDVTLQQVIQLRRHNNNTVVLVLCLCTAATKM